MCKSRRDTKIHPPPRPRQRMQSSSQGGESSSAQSWTQDLGRPEDAEAAKPEDAGLEVARKNIAGTAGEEDSGKPEESTLAPPEDGKIGGTGTRRPGSPEGVRFEETRNSISRRRGRECGETRRLACRQSWKMRASGTLED